MNLMTYSGRSIDLDRITAEDINFNDIAHSLSHICRFTGHTPYPYSVARHSMLVLDIAIIMDRDSGRGPEKHIAPHAILHDTPEYLLNDTARPVKERPAVRAAIGELENSVLAAIYGASRLELPSADQHVLVKLADDTALEIERRFFFPWTGDDKWSHPKVVALADELTETSPFVLDHVRLPRTPQEDRHAMGMAMLQHATQFGATFSTKREG